MQKISRSEFVRHCADFFNSCLEIQKTKGDDYTIASDIFESTKDLSKRVGIREGRLLAIFLQKHLDAIFTRVRTGEELMSETLDERIADSINFLLLIREWYKDV